MTASRREFLITSLAGATAAAVGNTLSIDAATTPTIGMMFPPANYQVPPEARRLYPTGVTFLAQGLGLERMTPAEYDRIVPRIGPAAVTLKKQGAQAISIMGTSLTFYKGAAFNQQLIDQVKKATGLPATSMSSAIVHGLTAVNAKRIAVATAYTDVVNDRLRIFLEESGFTVLGVKGLNIERFADAPSVTDEGLRTFSAGVFDAFPKADALAISCGALKTLDLIVPLEQHCKVPVISSTPHAFWDAVRLVGLGGQSKGFGRLLERT
jgi:arylmalonate decarboxylase